MIRKFGLDEVRQFLIRSAGRGGSSNQVVRGSDDVFVFSGTAAQLLPAVGLDPAKFVIPEKPKLYGLSVKEIPGWDITLAGRAERVDDIAGNEDLLFQAYLVAYPATCPECHQHELIPVTVSGGGDKNRRWQGVCISCEKLHLMIGREAVVSLATMDARPEETWRDRKPLL